MRTKCLIKLILLLIICGLMLIVDRSYQHGRLFEPPARNTMWRFGYKSPTNYNDNELFCGGIGSIVKNDGKCGICGDPFEGPRLHETGSLMAPNRTVRNYFPGSTIDILVDIVANHGGTFEYQLCWRDQPDQRETEECFESLVLVKQKDIDSSGPTSETSIELSSEKPELAADQDDENSYAYELDPNRGSGSFAMSVQLPANRTCEHCILRWHWRTANNWGRCDDGSEQVGCGHQEIYRNCADISIKRDGSGIGLFSLLR